MWIFYLFNKGRLLVTLNQQNNVICFMVFWLPDGEWVGKEPEVTVGIEAERAERWHICDAGRR